MSIQIIKDCIDAGSECFVFNNDFLRSQIKEIKQYANEKDYFYFTNSYGFSLSFNRQKARVIALYPYKMHRIYSLI